MLGFSVDSRANDDRMDLVPQITTGNTYKISLGHAGSP